MAYNLIKSNSPYMAIAVNRSRFDPASVIYINVLTGDTIIVREANDTKVGETERREIDKLDLPAGIKRNAKNVSFKTDDFQQGYYGFWKSSEGEGYLNYLKSIGADEEGVERIIGGNFDSNMVAGTNPKQGPGLLLVNADTIDKYVSDVTTRYSHLTEKDVKNHIYMHEAFHRFTPVEDLKRGRYVIEALTEYGMLLYHIQQLNNVSNDTKKLKYAEFANLVINRYLTMIELNALEQGKKVDLVKVSYELRNKLIGILKDKSDISLIFRENPSLSLEERLAA